MFNNRLLIEVPPVRHDAEDLVGALDQFTSRYQSVLEHGDCVCLTDNAMGRISFQGHELISELELPVQPEQVMIHLNTYHTKEELEELLAVGLHLGVRNYLIVTGDGNERLHHMEAKEIGADLNNPVTSVELMEYVRREYQGITYGCAFNPYEPQDQEFAKLERKRRAGASFIITQPVIDGHDAVDRLVKEHEDIPIMIGAWMSRKLEPIADIIGRETAAVNHYDPISNLKTLSRRYPQQGFYLSMVGFKRQYLFIKH